MDALFYLVYVSFNSLIVHIRSIDRSGTSSNLRGKVVDINGVEGRYYLHFTHLLSTYCLHYKAVKTIKIQEVS